MTIEVAGHGFVAPMLATAVDAPGEIRDGFAYEFKWDGVRVQVATDGSETCLRSRRGEDVTARYPELAGIGAAIGRPGILDGEVVAFGDGGAPSFSRLQRRMNATDPGRIAALRGQVPVAIVLFDVLALDDRDLMGETYERRRAALAGLELAGPSWQVPPVPDADLDTVLGVAHRHGLEGVVAKRRGSTYQSGRRSPDWRKLRLMTRQEFVIGGYRHGTGSRSSRFGSLLIGAHDEHGRLRYCGSVGSGFTEAELDRLQAELDARQVEASPFHDPVPHRQVTYVAPELVCEVRYSEWTPDGNLRQPSYKGLRDDKPAAEVRLER